MMNGSKSFCAGMISLLVGTFLLAAVSLAQTGQSQGNYVTTATVNVRKGPGTNYETIAKIPKGTKVEIVGREGRWLKVQSKHGNPPGYIDEKFAVLRGETAAPTARRAPGTYITTTSVNIRRGPGTNNPIIAKIAKDTKVQVVDVEGDWLKVQSKHGNPPGYIHKRYARLLPAG